MSGGSSVGAVWRAHLRLARISNLPTILTNVLAAAVIAGVRSGAALADMVVPLTLVAVAMGLFYSAGMYLNDYFDYQVDCRERPERPLPSGLLKPRTVLFFALGYFVVGLILLAFTRLGAVCSGVLLVGVIVVYDRWHKRNPLSHFVMALARGLVYLTTFMALAGSDRVPLTISALLLCLYVAGLTYIARSETRADFKRYWPIALLVLPAGYFGYQAPWAYLPVAGLFLLWCAFSLQFVYRRANKDIGGGIGRLIAGIALFDAMVLAAYGWLWPVALCLGLFVLTRLLQRYIAGT